MTVSPEPQMVRREGARAQADALAELLERAFAEMNEGRDVAVVCGGYIEAGEVWNAAVRHLGDGLGWTCRASLADVRRDGEPGRIVFTSRRANLRGWTFDSVLVAADVELTDEQRGAILPCMAPRPLPRLIEL